MVLASREFRYSSAKQSPSVLIHVLSPIPLHSGYTPFPDHDQIYFSKTLSFAKQIPLF